jgi:hypothetical protein
VSRRFFEEYKLTFTVRIATPVGRERELSSELFDALNDAISARKDILVGVASILIEPTKGDLNE